MNNARHERVVLLVGPEISTEGSAYGGGAGGYTRNMEVYLRHFRESGWHLVPCFHTVRKKVPRTVDGFFFRFWRDMYRLIRNVVRYRPHLIHVMAQYRSATAREFGYALICRFFSLPMLFEVKAGVFDSWYQTTGRGNRWMIRQIMKTSALVLVEGRRYVEFVRSEFGRPAVYFPNHVPTGEVSASVAGILNDKVIRIVFIGFCYEGKGVFELVRGCCLAAGAGVDLKLTLVGQEELKFGRWLDELDLPPNLEIERMGRQPHRKVLRILTEADCFCLPSKHPGEGHNNSVNEAMMLGKCLIISSAGFLPDILSNEEAYFLRGVAEEEVARSIEELASSRETARAKAARARELLLSSFTTGELYPRLAEHYAELLSSVGRR